MRTLLVLLVAGGVLLLGAAPAAPPDAPVSFIKVDELRTLIEQGRRVDIIDVRSWDAYQEMHIKGARSMPIRAVESRAAEISKTAPVVLY